VVVVWGFFSGSLSFGIGAPWLLRWLFKVGMGGSLGFGWCSSMVWLCDNEAVGKELDLLGETSTSKIWCFLGPTAFIFRPLLEE